MSRRMSKQEPVRKGSMTDHLARPQETWLSLDDSTEDVRDVSSDDTGTRSTQGSLKHATEATVRTYE